MTLPEDVIRALTLLLATYLGLLFAFASHEAGHAIAAAANGVHVHGLKVGVGPSVRFNVGGMAFAVSPIPGNSHATLGEGVTGPVGFFAIILAGMAVNLFSAAVFGVGYYFTRSEWLLGFTISCLCIGVFQFIGPSSDVQRAISAYKLMRDRPPHVTVIDIDLARKDKTARCPS